MAHEEDSRQRFMFDPKELINCLNPAIL
jgi:hypothetical protein